MIDDEDRDEAFNPTDDDDDDLDEDDVQVWDYEKYPRLAGPVHMVKVLRSKYGAKKRYLYLEIDGVDRGQVEGFHAAPTAAKSQMAAVQPQVGDVLVIRYKGEKKSKKNGTTYKDFSITSDRKVEIDWSDMQDDGDE